MTTHADPVATFAALLWTFGVVATLGAMAWGLVKAAGEK